MKKSTLFQALAGFSIAFTSALVPPSVKAQACPAASTIAVAGDGGRTAFNTATGGSCSGTPDAYGVTVFKMGLCASNPSGVVGAAADYSTCSLTFEDSSGSSTSFGAGGSSALPAALGTRPEDGTYSHAIILLSTNFVIKAEYGPLGDGSTTWYSTGYKTADTTGPAVSFTAPTTTFGGASGTCEAVASVSGSSGTMTGYILDSSEALIADSSAATCPGATYILGVVKLNSAIEIDSTVTALAATFSVTDNGTTVMLNDTGTAIVFDGGPFDVSLSIVR